MESMALSEQFWVSVVVQGVLGIAVLAMMKQQLRDLIGWMREMQADVKELQAGQKSHEGRISHVEGKLGIPRIE